MPILRGDAEISSSLRGTSKFFQWDVQWVNECWGVGFLVGYLLEVFCWGTVRYLCECNMCKIIPQMVNQSHYRPEVPRGFQEVKAPRFRDNGTGQWYVVSLTHRPPLHPGNTPGTHFCQRLSRPQGHSAIGRIMSMKNSNDTIWIIFICTVCYSVLRVYIISSILSPAL